MDFPSQSSVNERKQGSASQGLHCDTKHCSTFSSLIEGNLQELGPHSNRSFSVGDGKSPLGILGKLPSSIRQPPALWEDVWKCSQIYTWLRSHIAKLNIHLMPTLLIVFPVLSYKFLEHIRNLKRKKEKCTEQSGVRETCCCQLGNSTHWSKIYRQCCTTLHAVTMDTDKSDLNYFILAMHKYSTIICSYTFLIVSMIRYISKCNVM